MATPKPQANLPKKPVVKALALGKKAPSKGLFEEYYYQALAAILCVVSLFLRAAGMSFQDALFAGLLLTAIVFFGTQVARYLKHRSDPQADEKPKSAAPNVANKVAKKDPSAAPRLSKDYSPLPPAGDKRYPPPSPFIKPPK